MALRLPVEDDYMTLVFKLTFKNPKFVFSFKLMNIAAKSLQTILAMSYSLFRDAELLKSCATRMPERYYTN